MIHILARITLKPESAATGRDILSALVTASRKEAGCLDYQLLQRADAPHVFQTVECWTDQPSIDAHMAGPNVAAAIAAAGPHFAEPPEILAFNKLM